MKKLLLLLTLVPTLCFAGQDFDYGWNKGWDEGWRQVRGGLSISPVAPVAPVAPVGEDNFFGGYNLGFLAGWPKRRSKCG
jgi:hypothetical protein